MQKRETYALIVAAGRASRMRATLKTNKVYAELDSKPVLSHSIERMVSLDFIKGIIVVIAEGEEKLCRQAIGSSDFSGRKVFIDIAPGGKLRWQSVYNGLLKLSEKTGEAFKNSIVLVHDGARPNFSVPAVSKMFERFKEENSGGEELHAITLAAPSVDTLCRTDAGGEIISYEDRRFIYRIQTPQIFSSAGLISCFKKYERGIAEGRAPEFGDETSMLKYYAQKVKFYEGSENNIKITTPEDIERLNAMFAGRKAVE